MADQFNPALWSRAYRIADSFYAYYRCDDETRQDLASSIAAAIQDHLEASAAKAAGWSEWGQPAPSIDHLNGGLEASEAISAAIRKMALP